MYLTVAAYIRKYVFGPQRKVQLTNQPFHSRSLIAAFFGNVVGALLVALPATYFYLMDHDAGGLRAAENGMLVSDRISDGDTNEKR
ncbi:hypothetical protein C0992_011753 [Termitomyces sp. T32_za158]|nr:hypothetical protein C0992_011753 [Termitomyces sp. T32_za158]